MKILRQFARGSVNPCERKVKSNSEYTKILRSVSDSREKFEASLDEDQKKLFETLNDALLELNTFDETEQFVVGFKLGSLIMAEVMSGVEEITV